MGEHGDSQFIPVSHIQIGGIPVKEYLSIHPEYRDKMDFDKISAEDKVCGFHIVEGKGCTEFGIGAVLSNIARAVMHDERGSFRYPFSLKENMENRVFRREYHV